MICSKPGSRLPDIFTDEEIYVIVKNGRPVAAALSYPAVVRAMDADCEIVSVRWLG